MKSIILRILLRKHPSYSINELLGTSVLEGMIGFALLPPPHPNPWAVVSGCCTFGYSGRFFLFLVCGSNLIVLGGYS